MSITKNGKILATLVCLIAAVFCLFSCANVTESPNLAAKKEAEQKAQEVLTKLVWDAEDRTAIVESISLATSNKNYPNVVISWESSEPDVISSTGAVVRPGYNDERAYLDGENNLVQVTLTATVVASYTLSDGETLTTEPLSKQFSFTVLTLPETIDSGDIKTVKANAWNYVFEEKNADKALVTNNDIVYNVAVKGIVTAKLDDTKGFAIHDGTEGIYVFATNTHVNVGDTVYVVGGIYSYYGSLQIGKDVSSSVIDPVEGMKIGEYKVITPEEWETRNAPLGDDVIGYLGGELLKVRGTLKAMDAPNGSSDEYCLVDPFTGEQSWIYYKSYTDEMQALLDAHLDEYVELKGVSYDRDTRLVKNQLLWDGGLEVLEAPVVSDEQRVDAILNPVALEDSYTEDFDLPVVENGVWEVVSGTGIVIENGVAKVTQTSQEQKVVLKVTVKVGEVEKSKEFEITIIAKVEEKGPWSVVSEFQENVAYKFGLVQTNLAKTLYITGEMNGYYFATTEDVKQAADVYVVAVEGGYNLKAVKADGTVSYIEIVQSGTYINVKFNETASQVWSYNEEHNTFTAVVGENTYYLGTYKTYETVSASTIDKAASSFVCHLYEGNATVATEFAEGVAYAFGLVQTNLAKTLYITGEMNGYYFATTEDVKQAADVYVVAVEGGYNLKAVKADGTVSYIEIVQSGTYINVKFNETASQVWSYNEEHNTFTALVGENTYYLGTYKTYNTVSASTIDKAASSFVCHLYDNPFGPNAENGGSTEPEPEEPKEVTIEEALKLADDTKVIVKGIVARIDTAYSEQFNNISLTIVDATGALYIYRLVGNYNLGDELKITGQIGSYNGAKQVAAGATAEVLSTGNEVPAIPTEPEPEEPEGAVVISFADKANRTSYSTEQQVWEQNGIKVTNNKSGSTTDVGDYANPVRFYAKSELIIEYTSAVTKIVINTAGGKDFNSNFTVEGATVTVVGTVCTIEFDTPVTSLTIASLPYQVRVSSIEVYPAQ